MQRFTSFSTILTKLNGISRCLYVESESANLSALSCSIYEKPPNLLSKNGARRSKTLNGSTTHLDHLHQFPFKRLKAGDSSYRTHPQLSISDFCLWHSNKSYFKELPNPGHAISRPKICIVDVV